MKDKTILSTVAILAVVVLEVTWITTGHNHSSFTLCLGIVAGLAGFTVGRKL